jgi:hypothetical protein
LRGDKLLVEIEMVCPVNPDDAYSAILTITSSNSADTTNVPLDSPTGQVEFGVFSKDAIAAPGSTASWVIFARSLAGPGGNVTLIPLLGSSIPVSIPPVTAFLPRRAIEAFMLTATVGDVTPPGTYDFDVAETIFDGADTFTEIAVSLNVTNPLVLVTSSQPSAFSMVQGSQIEFDLDVQLKGVGTDFNLTIDPTQPGLTCTFLDSQGQPIPEWHVKLWSKVEMKFHVRLTLALDAAISMLPLAFSWNAYNGTENGKLYFGVNVLPQAIVFSSGTLGPSTVTASAFWLLNAQGYWNFIGSIHESGVIGHAYCLGMALNVKDSDGIGFAVEHHGSVEGNTPLGGNDDQWKDFGFDQRIIDLWPSIVSARSSAYLDVTTDLDHIVVAVLEALGIAIVALLAVAEGRNWSCQGPTLAPGEGGRGVDIVWT